MTDRSVPHATSQAEALELTVVIPCLNEARSLARVVDETIEMLERFAIEGEVVVADNGSTDGSAEIAAAHGARVVHVPVRGYGSALRGGTEGAVGKYVVFADADGQHEPDDIPRILDKLREGYDLVVGNRFTGGIQPGSMTFSHRYIGNPIISGLLRLLFHPKIHDAQCGMRGFSRAAFTEMDTRTTGFEFSPEMVVKAVRHHLRMTEVPITVKPDDRDHPPHLRTVPDGWRHLTFLLMCSPTWLFIVPGIVLLAIGVADVSWIATGEQHIGRIVLDTRDELFGVLLASIGFDIASIGFFARVFSYSEPLRGSGPAAERVLRKVTLEQGLLVAASLVAVGLIGGGYECLRWARQGFHQFPNDRLVIFFSTWLVLGIQVGFASFFLSMLGISRKTWIGDET
jgi:hypothetical protein